MERGRFAGLADVQVNKGGIYFEPGNYVVRLGKIDYKTTRKGPTFIVETEVVESDCATRGPGSKPSYVLTRDQEFPHYQLADMKAFAAAVLSIDDPDTYVEPVAADDLAQAGGNHALAQSIANNRFWEQALEEIVGPTQPCDGLLIRLNCVHVPPGPKSRPGSKGRTRHTWGPIIEATSASRSTRTPAVSDDEIAF
jgi:hypothetical protein